MTFGSVPFVFDEAALDESARRIMRSTTPLTVGIIAGSGIHSAFEDMPLVDRIPYGELPALPSPTIAGHRGELLIATIGDAAVAVFCGRFHLYEGYTVAEVVTPIVLLYRLGVKHAVLTNAAGGLNPLFSVGDLVLASDVVNMTFRSMSSQGRGTSFTLLTPWRQRLWTAAKAAGIPLAEGTYVAVHGPSYETPAEVRFFRRLGDCIGMSTVHELDAAQRLGIESVVLSLVTNTLSEVPPRAGISHAEVLTAADRAQPILRRVIEVATVTAVSCHEH